MTKLFIFGLTVMTAAPAFAAFDIKCVQIGNTENVDTYSVSKTEILLTTFDKVGDWYLLDSKQNDYSQDKEAARRAVLDSKVSLGQNYKYETYSAQGEDRDDLLMVPIAIANGTLAKGETAIIVERNSEPMENSYYQCSGI